MSRFRTRKLEESGGHRHCLGLGLGPLGKGRHGLGRNLAAYRRVGPAAVVVSLDELDHRVFGGIPGREAPPVAHLVLQRREERSRHCVVARPLGQEPAGAMGAAVGVEYRVSRHVATRFGRCQRRYRDVRRHSLGKRPAHHHAGAQVDDRREVQPPLADAQVRDVAHELVGGHGAGEVAPHQVGPGLHREFGVLHLELAYAPFRLAKLAVLGLRVGPAGKLAPAVLHPFVHGLGIQAELCAVFRYRPARRDDVVGGLSPELVGVLGGWVWHGIPSSRSSLNAF